MLKKFLMSTVSQEPLEDIGVDKALSTQSARFRLSSKALFLTYPKCPWSHERLLEHFKSVFARYQIIFIVVAQELHKDNTTHLHAFVSLECPYETRNPRAFDLHSEVQIEGFEGRSHVSFHPNIHSRIKSQYRVMAYITKDGNYSSHGVDVKEFLSRAKSRRSTTPALVAQAIQEGSTLQDINAKDPEFVMMNLKTLQTYQTQTQIWTLQQKRSSLSLTRVKTRPSPFFETPWNLAIATWLNDSIRVKRPRKSKQLWISSSTSAGKSTTILRLIRAYQLNVYVWPVDEDYFDEWEDGAYDLIWLDEYKAQKTIQVINRIADGMPTSLKRKFKPPFTKYQNVPLVVCSNGTPSENYHNTIGTLQHNALLERFTVVEVPDGGLIRLDYLENSASPYDEYDIEHFDAIADDSGSSGSGDSSIVDLATTVDSPSESAGSQGVQASVLPEVDPLCDASDPFGLADDSNHPPDDTDDLGEVTPSTPIDYRTSLDSYSRKRVVRDFFDTEASSAKR